MIIFFLNHLILCIFFRALTCANSRKGCKATAKIPPDGDLEQIILLKGHNHPPDMNLERKHNFLQELRKVVSATLHTVPLRSIYESVLELLVNFLTLINIFNTCFYYFYDLIGTKKLRMLVLKQLNLQ